MHRPHRAGQHATGRRAGVLLAFATSMLGGVLFMSGSPASAAVPRPTAGNGKVCTIIGTIGNDRLLGTRFADVICGLGGNDTVDGGGGNDTVDGNDGDDTLTGSTGNDALIGGTGTDTASYAERTTPVTVTLDGRPNDGVPGESDTVGTDVEGVTGGSGNDTITGGNGHDRINGGPGNDTVDGGPANDTITGGTGNDGVRGGTGNDGLHGNGGDDTLTGDDGDDTLHGNEGNDRLDGGRGRDVADGGAGRNVCTRDTTDTRAGCTITVAFPAAHTVVWTGRLLDADGAPVPGAQVDVRGTTGDGGATTGVDGGFTLAVSAGAGTVSVRTGAVEITTTVTLTGDIQRNITLPRPTRVTVHATDHVGAPLTGAKVYTDGVYDSTVATSLWPGAATYQFRIWGGGLVGTTDSTGTAVFHVYPGTISAISVVHTAADGTLRRVTLNNVTITGPAVLEACVPATG
jgi:protocatechuate 3,4-dioxygenase beta subunit